ncbi:MAG: response regulator [Nitrospina sp.]|jgi:CheY-like chemotaxis protein|nr:response regulator [Nitrospina sp.]
MIDDRKKSVKILVVEDDEASSTIIVRFLNQMGFTKMVLAENGSEALNKLYLNKVNLIISDWRMPDMDGLEFFKKAKREGLLDGIPFLMVSAENEKSRVAEALQSGVSDYVLKPVDYKILVGKVEKLLNL